MGSRRDTSAVQHNSECWFKVAVLIGLIPFFMCSPTLAKYGGGSGDPNDPYLIYTAEQLNSMGFHPEDADKHFKLRADIDLSAYQGNSFNRIGFYGTPATSSDWYLPFSGVFDGNDHTISNFTYVVDVNEPTSRGDFGGWDVGLFGTVSGSQAQIKNLGLIDPNIYPAQTCSERVAAVGAIAGRLEEQGSITNCYVKGGRVSGDFYVGGLVGSNKEGIISNCFTTCSVTWAAGRPLRMIEEEPFDALNETGFLFGGLVGTQRGRIYNCYATGKVEASTGIGGLVGSNDFDFDYDAVISECFTTGTVSGTESVGGLVGMNFMMIRNCYATGSIAGDKDVGGLLGTGNRGLVENSFSIGSVSGNSEVGGLVGSGHLNSYVSNCLWDQETSGQQASAGGTGKTTEQMQDFNTFVNAGWDLVNESLNGSDDIWVVSRTGNSYARLAWEAEPQPFIIFDFNEDPNWVALGPWAFGIPAGLGGTEHGNPDPNRGYTGDYVFGINLQGDYPLSEAEWGPFYLTTNAIDCSNYHHVQLQFARWLNTDHATYVRTFVDVSNDREDWHTVWQYTDTEAELADSTWQTVSYDISVIADGQATVYISWGYEILHSDAWAYSGWNIDDIQLLGVQPGDSQ